MQISISFNVWNSLDINIVPSACVSRLSGCNLTDRSCEDLATVLSSSRLKELDLSNNNLHDSGVKLLTAGLKSPQCTLDTLRSGTNLPTLQIWSWTVVTLFIGSWTEHTVYVWFLFRLSGCLITDEGFVALASALKSNPSHLRVLDLSFNHPGDLGQKLLTSGLKDPEWGLNTLRC